MPRLELDFDDDFGIEVGVDYYFGRRPWSRWLVRPNRRNDMIGLSIETPVGFIEGDVAWWRRRDDYPPNHGRSRRTTMTFEYGWVPGAKDRGADLAPARGILPKFLTRKRDA